MIEIRLLRSVVFLPQWKQPILHYARGQLVKSADLIERYTHAMGDRLDQLVVIDLPAQPLADEPGDVLIGRASLSTDADVLEPRDRGSRNRGSMLLVTDSEEPAHHGMRPRVDPARSRSADIGR